MGIVMGRLKNKENILLPIKRDASRKVLKGFTIASKSIDRTEEVCIQMDKDAQKDFTCRMTEDEYFRYKKNWWISLNKFGKNWTDERSFRLQRSVDQVAPSSPRVWRRATRTDSLLAIPEMASVVFFIQHILVVERFLVELMTINTKSNRIWAHERAAKRTVRPVVPFLPNTFRSKTLQEFLFVCCS